MWPFSCAKMCQVGTERRKICISTRRYRMVQIFRILRNWREQVLWCSLDFLRLADRSVGLPVYNKGALMQTMVGVAPDVKRVQTLGEYSEKLCSSTAKELVYPEAAAAAAAGTKDSQFEHWLVSVQSCLKSISRTPRTPATPSRRVGSPRAGSPTLTEKQQLCKPLKKYLEHDLDTKAGQMDKE